MKIDKLTQGGAMAASEYAPRIDKLLRESGENPAEWEFAAYNPGNSICREPSVLVRAITPDWPEDDGWASRKYGLYDITRDTLKVTTDKQAEYKSSSRIDRPVPTDADIDNAIDRLKNSGR